MAVAAAAAIAVTAKTALYSGCGRGCGGVFKIVKWGGEHAINRIGNDTFVGWGKRLRRFGSAKKRAACFAIAGRGERFVPPYDLASSETTTMR